MKKSLYKEISYNELSETAGSLAESVTTLTGRVGGLSNNLYEFKEDTNAHFIKIQAHH
jgi:hypothetical protein